MIDLHTHSYFSDGRFSPAQIVQAAAERGCTTLALTDHDSVSGVTEAEAHARLHHITLISGVEVTTQWDRVPIETDILGYYVDVDHPALKHMLAKNTAGLRHCVESVCGRLQQNGYDVTIVDVEAQNPRAISYLSVIHALQMRGFAPDYAGGAELFQNALEAGSRFGVPIQEAIAAIRSAGGVAVLAHPPLTMNGEHLTADELQILIEMGLQGIETRHPSINSEDQIYYEALAHQFGLATTGGSDEHGWRGGFTALGTQHVTQVMLDSLRAQCGC